MNEETFNMSLRRFLKKVGITAQREIEAQVREQMEAGRLKGDETLPAQASIKVGSLGAEIVIKGEIGLG